MTEALAFLFFATGCLVVLHAYGKWKARRKLAGRKYRRPYRGARPMSDTEYYYSGIWIDHWLEEDQRCDAGR